MNDKHKKKPLTQPQISVFNS